MTTYLERRCWLVALSLVSLLLMLVACTPTPPAQTKTPEPAKASAAPAKAPAASAPAQAVVPTPSGKTVAAPAGKKDLIILQGSDVQKMDPHMSTSDPDIKVTFNLYDNLITRGLDLKLKPALATEWKTINDKTWQFKLRQGVKFHNGEAFNAETVKHSLGRTIPSGDPKVYTRATLTTIERIDVVDEYTVNIVTTVVDPLLPDRLAFYAGQIIPKDYFQKVGADEFNAKPIGTGPLKFVEWVKDSHATFEVNKDWWGGKLPFEKVTFKPVPESAARVAALLKGEGDIICRLPPDDVERVNKSANAMTVGVPYAGLNVIAVNYKRPFPLDNKYFHQAASLALDRESIVRDLWRGQGIVPSGIYPSVDWCFDPNLPKMEYNQAKAREMLSKAGYKGEEVVFESTQGYLPNDKQMAEAVVTMWRDVGINAKLEIFEYAVRSQKHRDKSYKGYYWSDPTSILLDPDGMVYRLSGPNSTQDYNRENMQASGWDAMMQEARSSLDQARRKKLYDDAHKVFLEYLQWIPVIQPVESYGVQRYMDFKPMPNQDLIIEEVKFR